MFYIQIDGKQSWLLQNKAKEGASIANNKRCIPKIMFLAAVGGPHQRSNGIQFNGVVNPRLR